MESGNGVQVDKGGFVRIHNTILELLAKAPLRGQQFRCLFFLFRKTYGYNQKESKISLKEWSEGTNLLRQNVWRELQLLIKCKVIYMKSDGPKRANIYGFNKYFEQWNFESVITDDDSSAIVDDDSLDEPVISNDYSDEESVIIDDNKSVITSSHTRELKDNKDSSNSSLLAAGSSDDVMGLIRLAYEAVCRFGPSMQSDEGKTNLAIASDLIERYSYAQCIRGISTLKERNYAQVKKNSRNTIRAPVKYLKAIMEDDFDEAIPTTIVLDFALEDITQ